MFMNVIWADEAICLTCLPKSHMQHLLIGVGICAVVWLANWFHVLRFHLVHVYSQIRFNYVFHATIRIQARSHNKWCSPNEVKDFTCVFLMWRLMRLSVLNTCIKLLGQHPNKSHVCETWDYQEWCMVFGHDSTFACDIFTWGKGNLIAWVRLCQIFQPVHSETVPFPLSNTGP